MTQISLSKALAIIDKQRGYCLKMRKNQEKGSHKREICNTRLNLLNLLKKEFSHLSDADQLPLGL